MLRLAFVVSLAFCASSARAERCSAVVNGSEVVVNSANFTTFADDVKRREKLRNWPSAKWNKAWGTPPACNSGVLYDYLATTVPTAEIADYCLTSTDDDGYFLIPGPRNYRGMCRKTVCERVNTTVDETTAISAAIARDALQKARAPGAASAVAHKSGALILSGTAGTIATNLGTTGTAVITALSTPVALAAVGVSVVAVGGTVYMCRR